MTNYKVIALALSVASLTGCASALNTADRSTSTCPGVGPGACASPGDVYAITSGSLDDFQDRIADHIDGNKIDVKTVKQDKRENTRLPAVLSNEDSNQIHNHNTGAPELAIHADSVAPVRMPAQVMRIRIFPWTDKHDNLHSGGYIYTEIEQRTWSFGVHEEGALRNARVPHRITTTVVQPGSSNDEAQGNRTAASQPIAPPVRPAASRNAPSSDLGNLTLE